MALPHVSTGDPHVAAHNAERDVINDTDTSLTQHLTTSTDAHDSASIKYNGDSDFLNAGSVESVLDDLAQDRTLTKLPVGTNLNDIQKTGRYIYSTNTQANPANNFPDEGFACYLEVFADVKNYVKQIATYITLSPSGGVPFNKYARVMYGVNVWKPWHPIPIVGDNLGTFYGTGNPNGVITAQPGSLFINKEYSGYNGAHTWRKILSSESTNWVVEKGNTGKIDMAPAALNGWTFFGRIIRVENAVEIYMTSFNSTEATDDAFFSLPDGFKDNATNASASISGVATGGGHVTVVYNSGDCMTNPSPRTVSTWRHSFLTEDPWPDDLTLK